MSKILNQLYLYVHMNFTGDYLDRNLGLTGMQNNPAVCIAEFFSAAHVSD